MTDFNEYLGERSFASYCEELDERGYVIFEKVLPQSKISDLKAALKPYLNNNMQGRNDFEGLKSNRVYALLAKGEPFVELSLHPLALAFAERDLGESCILSACLAINLQPGETVQPWHTDDGHINIPRPRPSAGISAFWVLDDTTELNGATEVLPGSHSWAEGDIDLNVFNDTQVRDVNDDPQAHPDAVKAILPAGSLMIAKGGLLHRGGANRSDLDRLIVTPQYAPGWARPLENMLLAVPPDIAKTLPKRAQELIGYSIHPPFMGYVDGMHPSRTLPAN
ncbi:MAG: phytanoyl-CoA dioxygenase family protein [Pseudomonadales bacterium]